MKNLIKKYQTPEFKAWFYDRSQFVLSLLGNVVGLATVVVLCKIYPSVFLTVIAIIGALFFMLVTLAIVIAYWCHELEKNCSPTDRQEELERAHAEHWNFKN